MAGVLAAAGVSDGRITPTGLRWCIDRCISAGHIDKLSLPGLKPERHAVFPGGLAILYTLAAHFEIDTLWPAKGALRQGVIIDLHERIEALLRARPGDIRDASVATTANATLSFLAPSRTCSTPTTAPRPLTPSPTSRSSLA